MAQPVPPGLPEQLPAEVVALAERHRLGAHRATYRPQRLKPLRAASFVMMIVVGLFLFVLPGLYFIWLLSREPNFNKKQAARRLQLFDAGLILTVPGEPAKAFRSDSTSVLQEIVKKYVNGIPVGTFYTYTLTGVDGTTAKVNNFFEHPESWGPAIQESVTRAKLQGAMAALERGETLPFGDLAVSAQGVTSAKRGLAQWHEIENLTVRNGYVSLGKAGKWLSWSSTEVKKIPDVFLFFAIAERFLRQRNQRDQRTAR